MNSKPIVALALVLLALTGVLAAGSNISAVHEVVGDELIVTVANSGSSNAIVRVTAIQLGESLGSAVVVVPAGESAGAVFTITDEINPFEIILGVAAQN